MSVKAYRTWRRLAAALQAIVILGLPFVRINGQSALRFDVPSLRLHFFGTSIAIDEFYLVAAGMMFVLFLFIAITMLFGRLWCGWVCPQTVLSDLTGFMDRAVRIPAAVKSLPVALLSMLVAADLIWYFVPPWDFIEMLGTSPVVMWSFAVLSVIIFIDLVFIRRTFCRTVCPYAKLQSVLFDSRTMLIAYDPALAGECMGCAACRRVCPIGIDIRNGLDMACISCSECIDACRRMRAKAGKGSLVGYFWGSPEGRPASLWRAPLRFNVILALALSAVFLAIFMGGVSTRTDFAATIRLNPDFSPKIMSGSLRVNSYILSISNHTAKDALYTLGSVDARITTRDTLRLPPGGAGKFTIYAAMMAGGGQIRPERIKIELAVEGEARGMVLEAPFPLK